MKIGIFSETFLPQVNGVVTSICNMAKHVSKGFELEIFTVGDGPMQVNGFPVHRFRSKQFRPYPEYNFFVPSISGWTFMKKCELDLIHARGSVFFGLAAKRLSQKLRIPIMGTFDTPISEYVFYIPLLGKHKPCSYLLAGAAKKYMAWFYNRCGLVTAPSEVTKNYLIKLGCKRDIRVVSNGVDVERYSPANKANDFREKLCEPGKALLLHVGRITKEKGLYTLIKAAKELKEKNKKFKLVIVGRGPAKQGLEKIVASAGLSDVVEFSGFVPDEELPKYYANADLFVTASNIETEGIVLLEAMASGLPVVGPKAGAVPEVVKDNKNGLLFEPDIHIDMSKKIEYFLGNKTAIGKRNAEYAKGYSIKSVCRQMEGIYREFADKYPHKI